MDCLDAIEAVFGEFSQGAKIQFHCRGLIFLVGIDPSKGEQSVKGSCVLLAWNGI